MIHKDGAMTEQYLYLPYCLAAYAIYYLLSTLRCVFFHPLSKYPGPVFARFSGWPSFWHTLKGDRHLWIWQLHEVYGPVVRYRYDSIVFTTPDALHTIYKTSSNVQKAHRYGVWPKKAESPQTFSCVDKRLHARMRRILNAAISDRAVRSASEFVIAHVDRWLELSSERDGEWSNPRNMAAWADCLQFDIMAELCFGKSFGVMEPGRNGFRSIPQSISEFMWLTYQIMNSPFASTWIWLKPRGLDAMFGKLMPKKIKEYVVFVNEHVAARLEQEESAETKGAESGRKDFLHYLFQAVDPKSGRRYSRQDLFAEADMLAVAAADTTAATIAASFFYIARNPLVYRKLSEEIRTTFQSAEDIKMGPQLNSCKYLRATINETLRMSPPGANEFPREVLEGGLRIGEHYIPAGVNVGCGFWALFHDENIYRDPFVFRPDRWIVGDSASEEEVAIAEKAFAPFSLGIRGCPGKSLALMELSILLAKTFHGYEFRLQPGDKTGEGCPGMGWGRNNRGQYQTRDAFGPLRDGPYVQFASRA